MFEVVDNQAGETQRGFVVSLAQQRRPFAAANLPEDVALITQVCDKAGLRLTVVFARTYCCWRFWQMP